MVMIPDNACCVLCTQGVTQGVCCAHKNSAILRAYHTSVFTVDPSVFVKGLELHTEQCSDFIVEGIDLNLCMGSQPT